MVAWSWGDAGFGVYEISNGRRTPSTQPAEAIYAPGFVDIHIHGGFGFDWMEQPDCLPALADNLAAVGVEFFLPTTISYPLAEVTRAVAALPGNHPMIPGFHLEGPFLSPNFPGAQPPSALINPADHAAEWQPILTHEKLRIVSMAGELPGALDLIAQLTARKVIVSQAHTNAGYYEAQAAHAAGANHLTHFYNAMRPLGHREPGVVGFGLATPDVTCELIYDRVHVSQPAAAILLNAKPLDKVIAISDGSKAAGMPAGTRMTMWGHDVVVGENDVRLKSGALAGSAVTLLDVFRNVAQDFGVETAMRLTSVNPRQALHLPPPVRWIKFSLDLSEWEVVNHPS